MGDQLAEVLRERIVVVAGGRLAGLAEASAVVGNDPVTRFQKNRYLLLPGSTAQRVSVYQDDGLARAVILIVKIEFTRIFFSNRSVWHWFSPFLLHRTRFVIGRVRS